MSLPQQKQNLRREVKARLAALSEEECRMRSRAAAEYLLGLPLFRDARCILGYAAMAAECDPAFALAAAREAGKRIVYPKCLPGGQLSLYAPLSEDAFLKGAYGIWEPDPNRSLTVHSGELDLIVLPGLAFGRDLSRLGRGAGYYDRLMEKTAAARVGFAFDVQLFDTVPTEKWDKKADALVTNNGIIVNSLHSHL